jgi:hypothetical protein
MRYSSEILFLDSKSQGYSHVFIKNWKDKHIYIYIHSARRKFNGFYINYESFP